MTPARRLRDDVFRTAPGLAATEELFDSLADVLFCVKDCGRRYVAANDAFVRAAGLRSRAELLGRTARELFPPLLAAGYERQDDEVLANGAAVRDRLEMVTRRTGEIGWFVSQKVPVTDAAGRKVALAGISRDLATPRDQGDALGPLAEAIEELHVHSADPIRVAALAERVGLSPSQFQRRVLALTGLTPRQLLTKARVEAAARALKDTDAPLTAVAVACGFYDQAALSRQFRAATGVPPGEYRRAFRSPGGGTSE
ncbi:AraC family transcriptional regulator [Limnoglobus roseus]|uniref:AraC family transcriptional regulator n=1 Tax=Limnoglobus roseus TaxID=2598579 RepID=A0A5C1ASA0_9BACT|nr:AraC family transcriptional regulator [Limnoglobus roseus]QEL19768.1 AraC family transcriptional regulator [Limnoglobus roseus]